MWSRRAAVALALFVATPLVWADEGLLESHLVGRPVMALVDLPATSKGLDYYPEHMSPFDVAEHQERLVQNGVGVYQGDVVIVTKIRVKKKHVEFHLGAGGESQTPSRPSVYVPKSALEDELEEQLDKATSESEKKRLKKQLAAERDRRRRERDLRQALAEQEYRYALGDRTPEEWALLAGSRINVRYDDRVPARAMSPEGLMQALSGVIDFDPPPAPEAGGVEEAAPTAEPSAFPIRKGQTQAELAALFGEPRHCSREAEGTLSVEACTYRLDEATLEARFVDGVMVRYVLTSR